MVHVVLTTLKVLNLADETSEGVIGPRFLKGEDRVNVTVND